MEGELRFQDTEVLCLNIVETINTYFDRYPKGKINRKEYLDMVDKITKGLTKLADNEIPDKKFSDYIG